MATYSKKVFWQALIVALLIFLLGLFIGVAFEAKNVEKINNYYEYSSIFLMDGIVLEKTIDYGENVSCEILTDSLRNFAERIYQEALVLEEYDGASKMVEKFKLAHRKYDLLRTLLWTQTMDLERQCFDKVNILVYLYSYETKELEEKAMNEVWSKILFDIKQEKGNSLILIPIAVDSNLSSLNYLLENYELETFPVVIINNEFVVSELNSVDDLEKYFI